MTKAHGDYLIIEVEPEGECEMCGMVAELRPYGPMKKNVCFDCGMKDRAEAEYRLGKRLAGGEAE